MPWRPASSSSASTNAASNSKPEPQTDTRGRLVTRSGETHATSDGCAWRAPTAPHSSLAVEVPVRGPKRLSQDLPGNDRRVGGRRFAYVERGPSIGTAEQAESDRHEQCERENDEPHDTILDRAFPSGDRWRSQERAEGWQHRARRTMHRAHARDRPLPLRGIRCMLVGRRRAGEKRTCPARFIGPRPSQLPQQRRRPYRAQRSATASERR